VTVRSSKSLGVLFVRFKRSRRQRERKRKFQTRGCLFHSHKRRFFFDFGPKILFSTMLGSVFLFHRSKKKKKKNLSERERDVAAEKRERFSSFSLKRHTRTQKSRIIITHHNRSSFFSAIQRHLFCDATFRFRDTATKETTFVSFLFLLFETRCTRVRSSIVNTISIFIQRTTSGERFFL
jgi:hypothetical protein